MGKGPCISGRAPKQIKTLAGEQAEAADLAAATLSAGEEQRKALPSLPRQSSPIDSPAVTTNTIFERQRAKMVEQIMHAHEVVRKLLRLPAQLPPTVPAQSTNGATQKRRRGRPPGAKTRLDAPSKNPDYVHGNVKVAEEKRRKREEEDEKQAGAQLFDSYFYDSSSPSSTRSEKD